jgi:hypothetical protein
MRIKAKKLDFFRRRVCDRSIDCATRHVCWESSTMGFLFLCLNGCDLPEGAHVVTHSSIMIEHLAPKSTVGLEPESHVIM